MLEHGQIEGDHLRRTVDPSRTVHVYLGALLQQITQEFHPSLSSVYEVSTVHILDAMSFELDIVLLAKQFEVVRGNAMAFEVLVTLDRQNGRYVAILQQFEILGCLRVASHEDVGSHLGNLQGIEAAVINNADFSLLMSHSSSLRVKGFLFLKLEDPAWFSLSFNCLSLPDVVVSKLLDTSGSQKGV